MRRSIEECHREAPCRLPVESRGQAEAKRFTGYEKRAIFSDVRIAPRGQGALIL